METWSDEDILKIFAKSERTMKSIDIIQDLTLKSKRYIMNIISKAGYEILDHKDNNKPKRGYVNNELLRVKK